MGANIIISYKEQTVIEPFSPKHNVIVGRNGSGKSNFFAAIRFVLSDAYTQMGREERQALLHEGSGSAVMSAYVEIIFDNSDDRFPTGKDELILRRTIGLKKDEYSLDRKNATKTDVMNLLESAGFSRSNPYYIVPQGRVTTLTNMKDGERLNLLKEVAGTQVYEARRTESLKIMTETNNKRAKIDETLEYIKERLSELEEEKEELRGYQEKDKERRCLEYTFLHREQEALAAALDQIDGNRQSGMQDTDENREAFLEGEKEMAVLDTEINQLNRQLELLKIDRRQLEEDRRETARQQAIYELEVKTLSDGKSASEQARAQRKESLKNVRDEIARKEAELQEILPEYTSRRERETAVKTRLDAADASAGYLHAKQGRISRFRSKAERDVYLKKEIAELNTTLATHKANRMDADEEVKSVQSRIEAMEAEIAELSEQLDNFSQGKQGLADQISAAKEERERLSDERKLLRREEEKLDVMIGDARREADRAERDLSHTMDGATSRGLATIRRLKREQNIEGAYGTLAELLEVDDKFRTAVEVAAGNSLFHYVVDNADTATKLADVLYKEKGGRVTFMPLSQLRPRKNNLPKAQDALPMLDQIEYDPSYETAFQQVFGKTMICQNLMIAGQYARSHGVNAVTMDGDSANKKGALTGGYIDPRKSRLEAVRALEKWRNTYEEHRARGTDIKKQIERKDQEITRAMGSLQKLEQKKRQSDDGYEPLRAELRSKVAHLEKQKDQLDAQKRRRDNVESMLKVNATQVTAYEAELATDFKKALMPAEEQQLEQLTVSIQQLRKEWNVLSADRRELEARKSILEVDLRENLRLKLDQLSGQELDDTALESSSSLKDVQKALKRATKAAAAVEAKLQENEHAIEKAESDIAEMNQDKTSRLQRQDSIAKAIEKYQKSMEKSIAKKALIAASAAECAKNIRDLGVLPEDAFSKYSKVKSEKVRFHIRSDSI